MLLAIWAVLVAVTGGLDARLLGVPIRSRDPFRAFLASAVLLLAGSAIYRADAARWLDAVAARLRRYAAVMALALALALAAHGLVFGTFSAGSSDSFGYINQAYDWLEGRLPRAQPLKMSLPFDTSDEMQIPLGYRAGTERHTMVPTYAPGLPLMMAMAAAIHACGPFIVVPVFAALFVWFTFSLGRLAGGPAVGIVAALVLVSSPVVLFQTLWPMSDVPAGALWTGALVCALTPARRSAVTAGLLAALGLLVRPNLGLVTAVPLLTLLLSSRGRDRWRDAAMYCAPVAVVVAVVAVLNTMWFGGPTRTGYGATGELYDASNIWPNLELNAAWLWTSQSPWLLLALAPLVPPLGRTVRRRVLLVCALLGVASFASYASYAQFEEWWYLRFLMPAFGGFAVMVAAGIASIARTIPQPFGRAAAAGALCLMMATTIGFAAGKGVFGGVRAGEQRYIDIGVFAADRLPASAAIFAVQHSGSLRFYAGRPTLRFDWTRPEWASGVAAAVERAGHHPYLIVDDGEIPQVRTQFGFAPDAPLPWPVVARMREAGGITVFDMATNPDAASPVALEPGTSHRCIARARPPI